MTLAAANVAVSYGTRVALRPTSLTLARGELVALVGPNGAGKSSLLKALASLLPHAGSVSFDGVPLAALAARTRARQVAYLPQTPALHWPMRSRDLVALGRLPHRAYGAAATSDDLAAIEHAMRQTATAEFAERSSAELSVGERARVLLARALAVRAPVLLVDEPIAMLDPYHQLQIMEVLRAYCTGSSGGEPPAVVIAVLHDLGLAARFCTRVVLLSEGAVVGDDRPEKVLSAAALREHYRVDPWITRHENEPSIVPWRRVD